MSTLDAPSRDASTLDAASLAALENRRVRFVVRGLRTFLFGIALGLLDTFGTGRPLWTSLVHSVCIAMLCWFCIDGARIQVARSLHRRRLARGSTEAETLWPGWPWMVAIIFVGTAIGFSVGNFAAARILGHDMPGFFRGNPQQTFVLMLSALIPGIAITYWFYSREALAAKEALVQTAQRQAAEHQLKLLESQLEPHMLFNTLANLRVLIGLDPPRAQAMLDQLIAFLRATLAGSRAAQHPLSAEFARLGDYLALMQIRMGERLQARFDLPAALADRPVPPLLLQPLVENCIKHGLETAIAGGRIEVSAARDGSDLVLRVRDTGVGLGGGAGDGTRFGLVQVRERLATLYGSRASLVLADAADAEGGTIATLRLPFEPAARP